MKRDQRKKSSFSLEGALLFFVLIALVIQIAILTYDYIIKRTQNIPLIAILILIVVVMLSTICTFVDYLRRKFWVERPTREILSATERIASGDFSVRLTPKHPYGHYNEYDVIMDNINTMAMELGKSAMVNSDFISNVSHELKTPLTVIQNYVTLLQDDTLSSEERAKYATTLMSASKRLTSLVTNILQLNRLEHQQIAPIMEDFDLTEALTLCILQYEEQLDAKQLILEPDLDPVTITSSPSHLDLVWSNLISNAIKFTEPGGTISVSLRDEGDEVTVSVSDTGCGIDSEAGERIFEKFFQADTSHASEGNGLGLPLVKRIIDILGGKISVSSEVGVGSTFTITLKKNP